MALFKKTQKDKFTAPMFKRLLIPALASSFGWALSDMADAIVVGQKMSTSGLAAISLILPIYMLNCAIVHGFGVGASTIFSKILAKGKSDDASRSFSATFIICLVISSLIAILGNIFIDPLLKLLGTVSSDGDLYTFTKAYLTVLLYASPLFYTSNLLNYYLRNDNEEKLAGIGSLVGNICDIIFNITLVVFLNLGTFGAALSTAIGQIISISIYVSIFFKNRTHLIFKKFNLNDVRDVFKSFTYGFATAMKYVYQLIFFLACNNTLMTTLGETGVAVFDIIQNTSYLILYMYEGIARANQPLTSTYFGEKNIEGLDNIYNISLKTCLITGIITSAFIIIWPNSMTLLFGVSGTSTEAVALYALRIYGVSTFFAGMLIVLSNYYQACMKLKISMIIETLRGAALLLPLTFIFAYIVNVSYFWFLFPITEIITFVITLIIKNKYDNFSFDDCKIYHKSIEGNIKDITSTLDEIEDFLSMNDCPFKQIYASRMAIEEISTSIITYGLSEEDDGYLDIILIKYDDHIEIHLRDNASKFNPFELKKDDNLNEDSDFHAIGVDVIKKQAKEFLYRRYGGFNTLVITM